MPGEPITFGAAGGGPQGGEVSYNPGNVDEQIAALERDITTLNDQIAQQMRVMGDSASPLDRAIAGAGVSNLVKKKGDIQKRLEALQKQKGAQALDTRVEGSPWSAFAQNQAFGQSDLNLPGLQDANQQQARVEQQRVIQALQNQAAGASDSQAQRQLAQGFTQAGAQQRALGSSVRGVGGGAGLRAGLMGAGDVQRSFAGEREMLKRQEQQAAQAMLAQLLGQQHQQDVGLAGARASGDLANQQLNQEMERFYGQLAGQQQLADFQRQSDLNRARLGFDLEGRDLATRQQQQLAGMAATAGSTLASMDFGGGQRRQGSGFRQVDGMNSIVPEDDK